MLTNAFQRFKVRKVLISIEDLLYSPAIVADEPSSARGGRPFHSKLEPHWEFIQKERKRRQTWREIAESLLRERNVKITPQGVWSFYKTKRKGKVPLGLEPEENPAPSPPAVAPAHDPFSIEPEAPRPAALFEKTRKRLEQQRLEQEKQTRINEQHP